jgi:hypothetical protein
MKYKNFTGSSSSQADICRHAEESKLDAATTLQQARAFVVTALRGR